MYVVDGLKKLLIFLNEGKNKFHDFVIREKILYENRKSEDPEIMELCGYLKYHRISYFNYAWYQPERMDYEIFKDEKEDCYYTEYYGRKMYFKKSWDETRCRDYIGTLLCEQLPQSPHRYLDDELMSRKYCRIIDSGGGGGQFYFKYA